MLINKSTRITGKNVILVPYRKEHVLKYHGWMQSPELQQLTASEPLTLDEEFEMQESWLLDANKCTFIVLDKAQFEETNNEIASMIGDTNLFFLSPDDTNVAEAEIMIAETWARGRHCGWEAMLMMLYYGILYLNVKHYVVKISMDNLVSVHMFKNMGFTESSRSDVFREITFDKIVDANFIEWLKVSVGWMEVVDEKDTKTGIKRAAIA